MTGVCIGNSMVCTETWHKYNFEIEEIYYDCEKFSAGCGALHGFRDVF